MEAYLDLSLIVFLFNYILSFIYSMIICDQKKLKIELIILTIFLEIIIAIINTFYIPYLFIFFNIVYALFFGLFSLKYLKVIIFSLFLYYFNVALMLLIGGCFLYQGMLLISTPFVSLFILIQPIYITLIHLISSYIYKYLKYRNFKIRCKVQVHDKIYKGLGFYDSGNGLLYHDIPVIFIKGNPISNDGEIIKITGINNYVFSYLAFKGKLTTKKCTQEVYVVYVNHKIDFYCCQFLLNRYII